MIDYKYGWDRVKSWSDVIPRNERNLMAKVSSDKNLPKCPHLREIDNVFYCGQGMDVAVEENARTPLKPSFDNPIYFRLQGLLELQLFCLSNKTDNEKCINYQGLCKFEVE